MSLGGGLRARRQEEAICHDLLATDGEGNGTVRDASAPEQRGEAGAEQPCVRRHWPRLAKRFWEKRMAPNKAMEKERDLKEVNQGLDLIVSPLAQQEAQKMAKKAKARVAEKA